MRLKISRIGGRTRKFKHPDTFPEEQFKELTSNIPMKLPKGLELSRNL